MGYNKEGFKNPYVDQMLDKAAVELDPKKEKAFNKELAQLIFLEDAPSVNLFYEDNLDVAREYVKNWSLISLDYLPRTDVWLDK